MRKKKKRLPRLTINRETIGHLDGVAGGMTVTPSCESIYPCQCIQVSLAYTCTQWPNCDKAQ